MSQAVFTPPTPSLRARLLRPLNRVLLKPVLHSRTVQLKRSRAAALGRWLQLGAPRGTEISAAQLGGVSVEWVRNTLQGEHGTLLYLHGGAYVMGAPQTHRPLTQHLAARCGMRIAVPDYRLAPEHAYPAAVDDAVAVYRALLAEGADPKTLVIGGDSAGGGLTLACAQRLRAEQLPLPAALFLLSPWLDLTLSGGSMKSLADEEVVLSEAWLRESAEFYLREQKPADPFANLAGLPPMLVQVSDNEILLDDTRRLAAAAQQQGVPIEVQEWRRLWHVWQLMAGMLPEADGALAAIAEFTQRRMPP